MRDSVYIETSVVSYLVARPPADTIARQWQIWTEDWWRMRRPLYDCLISGEVLREAAEGDATVAARRLESLAEMPVMGRTSAVDVIADVCQGPGLLPSKARADAIHLAFACVYEADYLLTWNMKHLANVILISRLRKVAQARGWHFPEICTPVQLMGSIEYED